MRVGAIDPYGDGLAGPIEIVQGLDDVFPGLFFFVRRDSVFKSRKTTSATPSAAFCKNVGLEPGTACSERLSGGRLLDDIGAVYLR